MNQEKKVYVLMQDIQHPAYKNIKSGTEFSKMKNDSYDSAYANESRSYTIHPSYVENNPTWFKEKGTNETKLISLSKLAESFLVTHGERVIANGESFYRLPDWYKYMYDNIYMTYSPEQFDKMVHTPGLPTEKSFVATDSLSKHPMCKNEGTKPKKDHQILSTTYNKQSLEVVIYTVRRLSDDTIWTVGEETQHGIINKIEEVDNNPLLFYVGERNYPLFIYEAKKNKK